MSRWPKIRERMRWREEQRREIADRRKREELVSALLDAQYDLLRLESRQRRRFWRKFNPVNWF